MDNSSFRVAFWGLLIAFSLSIVLTTTSPERIRLALDTPPPIELDTLAPATMLADSGQPVHEASPDSIADDEPSFIEAPEIPDNRLAMDPEQPLLVPPFDSVSRPVPSPPEDRPIIDVDDGDNAGVPIEFEMDGDQPRIHVVIRPAHPREFVELPPPPLVEESPPPRSLAHGPTLPSLPVDTLASPLTTPAIPSSQPSVDEAPAGVTTEAIDELKSLLEGELASLRDEVATFASSHELNDRLADILEAQQQLDRDRVIHEISLLRNDLEELRAAEQEQMQAAEDLEQSGPPPAVVIVPSPDKPGCIDVELNSAPAAEAFAALGREAGQNLLTSSEIDGNVTAHLEGVVPWEAVLALAHSRDCQVSNDGGYLVVVPRSQLAADPAEELHSQLLFPAHLAAEEVVCVLQPLLTPDVGRIACTYGDHAHSISRTQAVLIVDRLSVIEQAQAILAEIDCPPRTLQVSANIMLVRREGVFRNGVLAALHRGDVAVLPPGLMPQTLPNDAACCDSVAIAMPQQELCQRLHQLADVEVLAMPCVQVLDRHFAQIAITDASCDSGFFIRPASRGADATGESILAVKPTIAGQGMIHLEVSRSGATATSDRHGSQKTDGCVATSVLIPDSGSVVIGELWQDAVATRSTGVLGPLRRFLPQRAAGTNASVELVVVISACIVQ